LFSPDPIGKVSEFFLKKIIQSQIAQTAGMAASARLTAVKSRSPSRNGTKGR